MIISGPPLGVKDDTTRISLPFHLTGLLWRNCKMTNTFKSSFGIFLAGVYLLIVILSLMDYALSPPAIMFEFGLLILTAPFSFLLEIVLSSLNILTEENSGFLIYVLVGFGGVINGFILYFIGWLITKIIKLLSTREKS